jgi:hypothetical protein
VRPVTRQGAAPADDSVRGTHVEHRASLLVGRGRACAVADAPLLTETRHDCVKRRPTTPFVRPQRCRIRFGPAV